MAGATKQISIRLKPEGGAEVVAEARTAEKGLTDASNRATDAAVRNADRRIAALRNEANDAALQARKANQALMVAQAGHQSVVQANIDRMTGVSSGGNANAQAAARSLYAADEKAARLAAAIRAEIDPLAAATDRYNAELVQMTALQARGHLTAQEFARAQELAKNRLDATTAALGRNTNGLTRNQVASRLNLTRQAADVAVTAGMGMNPAMIALQQGPQILEAFAMSGIKAQGAMLLLGGALTAAAAGVAVLGAAYVDAEGDFNALDRAATGLGRTAGLTAEQLQAIAAESAAAGEISVSAAEKQAAAFVSTGMIGREVLGDLIVLSKDYAKLFGQDAEEATRSLAKAMAEPDKAALAMTLQFGLMNDAQLDAIEYAVKHGDELKAQKLLIDALSGAVEGQASKIGEIEGAWEAATRAVSDYWDAFNKGIWTTPTERVATLDQRIAREQQLIARDRDRGVNADWRQARVAALEQERTELQFQIGYDRALAANTARFQGANQDSARDRVRNRARPKRSNSGEAERAERERLARERREEDRDYYLDTEVARASNDIAAVRRLEDTNAVRQRERQLIDDGTSAEQARTQALEEQDRLIAAREVVFARERADTEASVELEAARLTGMDRFVAHKQYQIELDERILDYQGKNLDLIQATAAATRDQLIMDEARAKAAERNAAAREREHQLDLAIARGDRYGAARLERESWIDRRAREIEGNSATPMNRGEGDAQAAREYAELLDAEMTGTRVDFVKGLVDDLRNSSIEDVLADQLLGASDRLIDHLIEQLFATDWAAAFQGQGGMPEGGGWLAALTDGLFGGPPGKNASGTDHWRGGLTWVGEEGRELVNLPRGAQVIDHQRSMRMALGGDGAAGATHNHYYLQGAVMADDLWKRIDQGDRQAARVGARQGASTAVSVVEASAAERQRAERMMRG